MSASKSSQVFDKQRTISVARQVVERDALAEVDGPVVECLPVPARDQYVYHKGTERDTHKPSFR